VYLILVTIVLLACGVPNLSAANAVFSRDGEHVYTMKTNYVRSDEKHALTDIDLQGQRLTEIPLETPSHESLFVDLSRTNDGKLLLIIKRELWAFDVTQSVWTRMCVAPPQVEFKRVAYDPVTEATVLLTRNKEPRLLLLAQGASEPERVDVSKQEIYMSLAFTPDGHLLFDDFRNPGEIWCGFIERHNGSGGQADALVLRANVFVTIPPMSDASGLRQKAHISTIAAGASGIYAAIYASPFGMIESPALVKFPLVHCQSPTPHFIQMSPKAQGEVSFNTHDFPGARVIFDANVLYLCASAIRDRIYFEAESERYLLADGRLQKLNIKGP